MLRSAKSILLFSLLVFSALAVFASATADGAWISYLRVLQEWGEAFPGFAKEVEGTVESGGTYHVYCLK